MEKAEEALDTLPRKVQVMIKRLMRVSEKIKNDDVFAFYYRESVADLRL